VGLSEIVEPFKRLGFVVLTYLLQSFGFYLPDAFASDAGDLAHLFQSVTHAILKAETHCKYLRNKKENFKFLKKSGPVTKTGPTNQDH